MYTEYQIDRVVLVVMDGLRAEAVSRLDLPNLNQLMRNGAWSLSAQTVRPSVTAAAMTSIFTGVPPERHGIGRQGFGIPHDLHRHKLLTHLLSRAHFPTSLFLHQIPIKYRWLASRLGSLAGAQLVSIRGDTAAEILATARPDFETMTRGFAFLHWADADRAGHRHGWTSAEYEREIRAMDVTLGKLVEILNLFAHPGTLLVVCSDHGGGGSHPLDHDSDHSDDTTIPVVLAGEGVVSTQLPPGVTLLDLPATILWALGLDVPASYAGRPLHEAFFMEARAA